MGNQQSTAEAITDTINDTVTNVMVSNQSLCGQNNSAIQSINIGNINAKGCGFNMSGITQTSVQKPNFSCFSSQTNNASLLTSLKNSLQQQATSELSGLGGAINSQSLSTTASTLVNDITNNMNLTNLSSCIQNNIASQEFSQGNINVQCPSCCNNPGPSCNQRNCVVNISNLSQQLTQSAVANCLSENSNLLSVINQIASEISQKTASSNTGISMSLLGGIGGIVLLIILIIIIL